MVNSISQFISEHDPEIKMNGSEVDFGNVKAKNNVKFDDSATVKEDLRVVDIDFESEEGNKFIHEYTRLDRELNNEIHNIFMNEAFIYLLEEYDVFEMYADNNLSNYKNEKIIELNKILINEEKYREIREVLIKINEKYTDLNNSFLIIKKNESYKKCLAERIMYNEVKFNRSNDCLNNPVLVLDHQSNNCNEILKLLMLDIRLLNNNIVFKKDGMLVTKELIYDMLNRNKIQIFTNSIDVLVRRHIEDTEVLNKKDQDYYYVENMLRNKVNSIYNENMRLREKMNYNTYVINKKDYEISKLTTILSSILGQIDDSINDIRIKLRNKYGNSKLIDDEGGSNIYSLYLKEDKSHLDHSCLCEGGKRANKSDNCNCKSDNIHIYKNNESSYTVENPGVDLPSQTRIVIENTDTDILNPKEVNSNLFMNSSVLTPIETEHIFVENVNIKTKQMADNLVDNADSNNNSSDVKINENNSYTELNIFCEDKDNKETQKTTEINSNMDLHEKMETNENNNISRKSNKRHNFLLKNYRTLNRKDIKSIEPSEKANDTKTNNMESDKISNTITKTYSKERIVFGDKRNSSVNTNSGSANVPISKKRTKSRERNTFERSTYINSVNENPNLMFKSVAKNDVFLFNTGNDSVFNELNESNESAKLLSRRSLKKVSNDIDSIFSRATKSKDTLLVKNTEGNNSEFQKINDLPLPISKVYKATIHNDTKSDVNLESSGENKQREKESKIKSNFDSNKTKYSFLTNSETSRDISQDIAGPHVNTRNDYLESINTTNTDLNNKSAHSQNIKDNIELNCNNDTNESTVDGIGSNSEAKIKINTNSNINHREISNTLKASYLSDNNNSEETIIQRNNTAPLISYGQYQKYFPFNSNNYMAQLNSYNSMPQYTNNININGIHYVGYGTIPNNIAFQGMNKNLLTSVPMHSNKLHKNSNINNNLGAM
ncbi:hypothetical protein RS030_6825 [Cryptosporidium xiaoi]|uniref:Uncharacterized protein n=1 Tax=Cryptosporidium xiaoi TaxID=659607 RepID=A0AAV9XUL0_9CRYT